NTMGAPEACPACASAAGTGEPAEGIEAFLTHLATVEQISASTQTQALSALLFLYRGVLRLPLDDLDIVRARQTTYVQPYLSGRFGNLSYSLVEIPLEQGWQTFLPGGTRGCERGGKRLHP
ncbi:MAG: hypothetical protein C0393_07330, partial [Anaerolinea sp.]|nr:hypothetical protein [Anaerolinea sp.]